MFKNSASRTKAEYTSVFVFFLPTMLFDAYHKMADQQLKGRIRILPFKIINEGKMASLIRILNRIGFGC